MIETKLTCYGGVGRVTGANFLFEVGRRKILIDCGMTQGPESTNKHNKKRFDYDPPTIDVLFVTHAHIDHTGLIPKLVKNGFKGDIYSTQETKSIARLLLEDSAKINKEKKNPLYNMVDVERTFSLWKTVNYHEKKNFGEFSIEFFDTGHILGSSMVKFTVRSSASDAKKPSFSVLFSGDIGNCPSPLLKNTEEVSGVDYLLIESVYGDRNHEDKETRVEKLKKILAETIKRKGTLLIPVFALERTQDILFELDNFFESGVLPSVPVFLDSPLAIKITNIYEEITKYYNESVQKELQRGDKIFNFPRFKDTFTGRESREIAMTQGPKIILAGSGMSTGGRIIFHEEIYLPDANNTILFVGYQAPGTLGRQIQEGAKEVTIDDKQITIRAKVERIDGFSAHADSDALVKFVETKKDTLKKVFVAMGEPKSSIFLAQRLRDELGVNAFVPEKGKVYRFEM